MKARKVLIDWKRGKKKKKALMPFRVGLVWWLETHTWFHQTDFRWDPLINVLA